VACAVRVYRKQEDGVKEGQGQASVDTNSADEMQGDIEERRLLVRVDDTAMDKAPVGVASRLWNATKEVLDAIGCALQGFIDEYPLWVVVLSPVWVPLYAFWQVIILLWRLAGGSDGGDFCIEAGAKRVPTFYSGIKGDSDDDYLALFAGIVIAMVFGGIHCVAWSFQFPSHAEQLLWRVSSLTITCVPALDSLVIGVIGTYAQKSGGDWAARTLFVILILAVVPYIFARITLLVLPFMALRSLSPAAYQTVQWTTFIPHV